MIQSDRQVQAAVARFVPVLIDVDQHNADFQSLAAEYELPDNVLPLVFIIRADGEQLDGSSGPLDRAAFLTRAAAALASAGTPLTPAQQERAVEGLETARADLADGDTAAAVRALRAIVSTGSRAAVVIEAEQELNGLLTEAQERFEQARGALRGGESLDPLLTLLELRRVYAGFNEVTRDVNTLLRQVQFDAATRDVFRQAELLDDAAALPERQSRRAAAIYRQIIRAFPGSPGAERAETLLAQLEPEEPETASVDDAASPPEDETTDEHGDAGDAGDDEDADVSQRADAALSLGRNYLRIRRYEQAREYLEQVLAIAPDSPQADEARRLLEELPAPNQ